MHALQKHLAELEGQLGEQTAQCVEAMKERDRLQIIETDLNGSVEKLTGEISGLRMTHQKELDTLIQARTVVEEELQKERNVAMKSLQDTIANHQWELSVAKTQADVMLADMNKMDDLIAGKFLCFLRLLLRSRQPDLCSAFGSFLNCLTLFSASCC